MRIIKKTVSIAIAILLLIVLSLVPITKHTVFASTSVTNSDGIVFDKTNGTITDYVGNSSKLIIPKEINGSTVRTIGDNAFSWCSSLEYIIIPETITSIEYSFFGCSYLTGIEVDPANPKYRSLDGVLFDKSLSVLYQYPIGNTRSKYVIPSSVDLVDGFAFAFCINLSEIIITDSVTKIDFFAFEECEKLTTIFIPESVVSIGDFVFLGCNRLESIVVDTANPNYTSDKGVLFNKSKSTLYYYPNGNTSAAYSIPYGVNTVSDNAFMECYNLVSVVIPETVTNVGIRAFYSCESLLSVLVQNDSTNFDENVFEFCSDDLVVYGKRNSSIEKYASESGVEFSSSLSAFKTAPTEDEDSSVTDYSNDSISSFSTSVPSNSNSNTNEKTDISSNHIEDSDVSKNTKATNVSTTVAIIMVFLTIYRIIAKKRRNKQ